MARASTYISILLLLSCSPRIKIQKDLVASEKQFQDHIGLMIYDPLARKTIVDFNAEKYFTPASNTKILTLLSALLVLGDSIPTIRYLEKEDSLIFWGTGDPSFLNSGVFQNERTYGFLKNHPSTLFFSTTNYYTDHFGPGWAWDDYNYSYSPERSSFPIYGNCMAITDGMNNTLQVSPTFFEDSIRVIKTTEGKREVVRAIGGNSLNFYSGTDTAEFRRQIPFHVTHQLIVSLLKDTLHREVYPVDYALPGDANLLFSVPSDSLYKVMMEESDNFIAEQLLQLCAGVLIDSLKPEIAIEYVQRKYLFDLPDKPQWVDGSGLSRYNLVTPRSIVRLWEKILALVPQERLFKLLAIGGKAGTIKNSYEGDPPYIFGKTGTLSNNHCLSGYLVTKKGKLFIFSFMNSNYTVSTEEIRNKIQAVLFSVHEKY